MSGSRPEMHWLGTVLALVVLAAVAVGAGAWIASPSPRALSVRVERRLQGTSGRAVGLSAIPAILRDAVVATEDERFYHHHGVDVIAGQVAKVLYLGGNDRSPWSKLEDAAVA